MKTFLLSALFLLTSLRVAVAQIPGTKPYRDVKKSAELKTRMNSFPGPLGNENRPGFSVSGDRHYMQHSRLPGMPKGNQSRSAQELTQKLDSTIHEYWDSVAGNMLVSWKAIPLYDAGGNKTSEIRYAWNDSTGQWVAAAKDEYTYDARGNNTLYVINIWNASTGQWVQSYQEGYAYNASGYMTLDSIFYYDAYAGQWLNWYKTEYTYTTGGNVNLYIDNYWDNSTSQWMINYKSVYTYDVNGKMTALIGYLPNENYSQWYFDYKEEYTYDDTELENLTEVNYYYWDSSSGQWILVGKDNITYDNNGNITLILEQEYDAGISQWVNYLKIETAYDAFGNVTTLISYWNSTTSQWDADAKTTDYYSLHNVTGIPAIPQGKIGVYPNPASGIIIFDGSNDTRPAEVELFDMGSKKVLEQRLTPDRQISIGHLPKGLYLYRLHDGDTIYQGKIMVE